MKQRVPKKGILEMELRGAGTQEAEKLEAVARLIARAIGHTARDRYRVDFEGPGDYEKVKAYYGWRR